MTENTFAYTPSTKMATLISDNYSLLDVMSRFGIVVGFGDESIKNVCSANGVDCSTFLAVVEYITAGRISSEDIGGISVTSLLHYLRQSHIYFLQYRLPNIRRKLLDGIEFRTTDVSFLIIRFFDEYTHEVRNHMEYEEQTVFSHIVKLLRSENTDDFHIDIYGEHHEQVGDRLNELKSLIIKYCPQSADVNLLNDALYDICRCEEELESHCSIENDILVPAIRTLEKNREGGAAK